MGSTFKWYPVVWGGFAILAVFQLVFDSDFDHLPLNSCIFEVNYHLERSWSCSRMIKSYNIALATISDGFCYPDAPQLSKKQLFHSKIVYRKLRYRTYFRV